MGDDDHGGAARLAAFEERLNALQTKAQAGFGARAGALEAAAAALPGERATLARLAHQLRGVARGPLGEAAGRLEAAAKGAASDAQLAADARALAQALRATSPDAAALPSAAASAGTLASAPAGEVLLVDDDLALGRLTSLALSRLGGFAVRVATRPDEVLAIWGQAPMRFALLDAMMPGEHGLALARRLRAAGFEAPIAILSAATPEELGWPAPGSAEAPYQAWWQKPLSAKAMLAAAGALVAE